MCRCFGVQRTCEGAAILVRRYVDDEGSIKDLPMNLRASDIANCCGKPTEVGLHSLAHA